MHVHGWGGEDAAPRRVQRALALAVGVSLAVTLGALALLWPSRSKVPAPPGVAGAGRPIPGRVLFTRTYGCRYSITPDSSPGAPAARPAQARCETSQVELQGGPERGTQVPVDTNSAAGTATLRRGDRVELSRTAAPGGAPVYGFVDYQRRLQLGLLGAVFAVLVVAVGRWRGAGALVGLAVTWLVLVRFLLPALLDGRNPIAVALAASSLILCLVLFVAHGVNVRTATALLGTLASLLLVGLLASVSVSLTRLTGLASEEGVYLQSAVGGVQLNGLLLAGMVIGSLGVLNDMTVTQASAVWELAGAGSVGGLALYRSAMRIGRDHIASTVYTLVLAYAGATLPLLLLFDLGGRRLGDVVTSEVVSEEVVRTLVGSIGLVACVPLTTALAVLAVGRSRPVPGP